MTGVMTTLAAAAMPSRDGDRFRFAVPNGWRMGRGAFGGVVIGSMIRAIEATIDDPARTLRSVTAELPGPVMPGDADIAVELLRTGSSVTTARAALTQNGATLAHVVAIAGAKRSDDQRWQELSPPTVLPWRAIEPRPPGGGFPEFSNNFEYRVICGLPGTGGPPLAMGWLRAREAGHERDAAYVAGMIDAWWPAVLVRMPGMVPLATISYSLDLISPPPAGDAPLLYRGTVPACADGYFRETRELWTEDGQLIALNYQTMALI